MKMVARASVAAPSEREVRDQIERITTSVAFRTSDRLKHFITFVASQALQGKGDNLKEYAVGVQVFGRETAFDPRTDPVVRVQARRLRARLERYYREEGQNDDIVVDLPPEADDELCLPATAAGLNFIRLTTPTTDDRRLPAVHNGRRSAPRNQRPRRARWPDRRSIVFSATRDRSPWTNRKGESAGLQRGLVSFAKFAATSPSRRAEAQGLEAVLLT